ncbi:MAG: hypothetical protein AB8F74_22245 [Saprospiraceae bacterium]
MKLIIRSSIMMFICLLFIQDGISQNFLQPTNSFSRKKPAYITLKNGKEIEAEFRSVKTKKGLFTKIWVADESSKKKEILAEDVQHMYLPASSWDKMEKAFDMDLTTADDDYSLNQELVKDGYAYFETVEVMTKKKKRTALMQLLNPAYAHKVRVYHNPWATETAGLNYGGVKLTGGDTKSFYVKVGDKIAFLIKKKDYSKLFKELYGDCKDFIDSRKKPRWKDFEEDVYEHAKACN